MRVSSIALLVTLSLAGCGSHSNDNMDSSKKPRVLVGHVEPGHELPEGMVHVPDRSVDDEPRVNKKILVTDDIAQITAVEEAFQRECDARYISVLEELRTSESFFGEHRDAFDSRRAQATKDLLAIMQDATASSRTRLRSAFELARLGEASAKRFIWEALRSNVPEMNREALHVIRNDSAHEVNLDLDTPDNAQVLLALFFSPDKEVQTDAISHCVWSNVPGAEDQLLAAFDKGTLADESSALKHLSRVATRPEAISRILRSVQQEPATIPSYKRTWSRWSLQKLIEHKDPRISEEFRQALHGLTLRYTGKERFDQHIAEDLAKTATAESIPILEEIIAEAKDPVSRGYAVEALARLQPDQAIDLLLAFIGRERAGSIVIGALTKHANERRAKDIIATVAENRTELRGEVARLLWNNLGPTGRNFAAENLERFNPDARMWLYWKINKLDVASAVRELVTVGVISEPAENILEQMSRRGDESPFGVANGQFDPTDPGELIGR